MGEQEEKTDWHLMSKRFILAGKILCVVSMALTVGYLTWEYTLFPYNIFLIIFEIAVVIIALFSLIRISTHRHYNKYDPKRLGITNNNLILLLTNITSDIYRYQEGASFYFNGVRFYKYSTIILAGISTIILGIDLDDDDLKILSQIKYKTFAKNAALIIGAIITVITSLTTYWNIEKYWLFNKTILNKLSSLKDDIENEFTSNSLPDEKIQSRYNDYKRIKGDFYKYWEGALSDRGSTNNADNSNSTTSSN